MNQIREPNENAAARAVRELTQLQGQAEELRAVITHLEFGVAEAEDRLDNNQAIRLVEANEQLVLAALRAQSDGEAAARALNEAARSAEIDALTELPNRVLLLDRFAHAIATAKRHGARLALLFLDLDNFKQINDTLGHAVGDQVLKLAAQCLASAVREADTVSRHGGDEFLILLADVSQASDAILVADKIIAALAAPSRVGDHVLRLTTSIGIALYPDDGEDAATLIDRADAAMYRAKRQGLGSFAFHGKDPEGERSPEAPAPAPPDEPASAGYERRHAQLREANEQLILAALSAQELQDAAEQAQPYRVLIEQMQEGAFMLNEAGTVLYCNQRFSTLVDTPRAAVLGQGISRFFSGAEADAFPRLLLRGPGGGASGEFTIHAADGAEVPVNISLVDLKVEEGMPRVVCGVVTDLTQNRRRSHELATANAHLAREIDERRRAEESLQLALDAAGMGSWDLDLATGAARRSLRHDQIFGHAQLLPGWNLAAALEQFVPEDRASVAEAFAQAETSGAIEFERRIRRAGDGAIRWLHMKGRSYYEDGRAVRIAGVVTDVTERRVIEEQLRQAQKMDAVGQLTGGIAHDFNNLLLIIGGSLDMLSRRMPVDEKAARLLVAARQGVERGAKLNQQLLAFSRRQDLEAEVISVGDLITTFEHLLDRAVNETIAVKIERASDGWLCHADPHQLETAILNLAINARDAMPDGGTLTLSTENRVVGHLVASSWGASAGDYVVVSVADTGIGMPPEVLSRVFEPFFTTKEVGKGTGLGLSQVYGFAKQSDGFVTIESEAGRGTTVLIHLPRTEQAQAAMQSAKQRVAPLEEGKGVVLVVEDDAEVRATASGMLSDLGYAVREADTARAALAFIQCGAPLDLVFSDVIMPGGMSGIELARELRERRPGLPVLLTSGYTAQRLIPEALADDLRLLRKPYTQSDLSQAIRETLRTAVKSSAS